MDQGKKRSRFFSSANLVAPLGFADECDIKLEQRGRKEL